MIRGFLDIEFSEIVFTRHVPPHDHPYYEYDTCEWRGDSNYILITNDMLQLLATEDNEYSIVHLPIAGIVEGMVILVGQYQLQCIDYYERNHAWVFERLN